MAVESCKQIQGGNKDHHHHSHSSSGSSSSSSSSSSSQGGGSGGVGDQECPLCLEILDLDDRSFFPCTCGYQICRFCWHRILSESSLESKGSCPACRKPYSENPANFKPLSVEDVQQKLKQQRKQKDQQKKQKTVDSRKHLGELRVVQKNLVFVVGITPRIADPELLKKAEYFGRFGKIHKIVVNCVGQQTTTTPQGTATTPSYGAYITYTRAEDALRAIQSVNNIPFDGKTIKASLGTTKYCSHFMRNQTCPKPDCMYLHCHGDPEASFTKEDMQQGKHQDYERKLIEEFNREQEKLAQQQQLEKEKEKQQQLIVVGKSNSSKKGDGEKGKKVNNNSSANIINQQNGGCSSGGEEEDQLISSSNSTSSSSSKPPLLSARDVVKSNGGTTTGEQIIISSRNNEQKLQQTSNSRSTPTGSGSSGTPTPPPALTNGHGSGHFHLPHTNHPPGLGGGQIGNTASPSPPQQNFFPQQINLDTHTQQQPQPPQQTNNADLNGVVNPTSSLLKPTELLSLLDTALDFDPFQETQKAFESIIQQEIASNQSLWLHQQQQKKTVSPPPGFCNNNTILNNRHSHDIWGHGGQGQLLQRPPSHSHSEDWIDPAIIYSSTTPLRPQPQQNNIGHLLGNSLLNDIFCGNNGGQIQQGQSGGHGGVGLGNNGTAGLGGLDRHMPPFNNHIQPPQPHHHMQLPSGGGGHNGPPPPPNFFQGGGGNLPNGPPNNHGNLPPFLQQNFFTSPPPPGGLQKFPPPPGFPSSSGSSPASATPTPISSQQQTQQQFINNNFFNSFPF